MSIYGLNSDKYEITLGYDEGMQGFWLIIHYSYGAPGNERYDSYGEEKYLFHNINNWPSIKMTIKDIKKILKSYNERIDEETLLALYEDAKAGGFFSSLDIRDFSYHDDSCIQAKESIFSRIVNLFRK